MELNTDIIQNVRKFPQLYQRKSKLADREKAWKSLAKSLKLNEQFLKSRWHILRERYVKQLQYETNGHHQNYFRYSKQMDFMRQHIKIRVPANTTLQGNIPRNWVKPEFVITAADLEFHTEDPKGNDEIMFMEIEEETEDTSKEIEDIRSEIESFVEMEDKCQEIEDNCQEIESNCIELEDNCQETENTFNKVKDDSKAIEESCKKIEVKEIKVNTVALEKNVLLEQAKDPDSGQTQQQSANPTVVKNETNESKSAVMKNNEKVILEQEKPEKKVIVEKISVKEETAPKAETSTKTDTNSVPKPESPVKCSRSEDAIFGELIVAMLKSMDPAKKKSIKKEIMNLLLS